MTPADHNKAIGIMHLIYGGFFMLMTVFMFLIFGAVMVPLWGEIQRDPNAPPAAFFVAIFGLILTIYAVLSLPSLIAGYALLRKKSWGRVAGIIASIMAAMSFPFGTALCVYSLWFFFGEKGRAYEHQQSAPWGDGAGRGTLHEGSPYSWDAQAGARREEPQHAYRPPAQPPDWRG